MIAQIFRVIAAVAAATTLISLGVAAVLATPKREPLLVAAIFSAFVSVFFLVAARIRGAAGSQAPGVLASSDRSQAIHPYTGLPMFGGFDARGTPLTGRPHYIEDVQSRSINDT